MAVFNSHTEESGTLWQNVCNSLFRIKGIMPGVVAIQRPSDVLLLIDDLKGDAADNIPDNMKVFYGL